MSNSCSVDELQKKLTWHYEVQTMRSILRLQVMITKTPQNVHKICLDRSAYSLSYVPSYMYNIPLVFFCRHQQTAVCNYIK